MNIGDYYFLNQVVLMSLAEDITAEELGQEYDETLTDSVDLDSINASFPQGLLDTTLVGEAGEDNLPVVARKCHLDLSSQRIAPVSLHEASLLALLTADPQQLSPALSTSRTVASSSSSCHSQETSPVATRHPFCVDRSIMVQPRRFAHKRNKSAPIWLHNPVVVVPDISLQRGISFDELLQNMEKSNTYLKHSSRTSTDEGVCSFESASTPSNENNSLSSCPASCDDEAYNTESSSYEFTGYPGLVCSRTWIDVHNEQACSDLVSVKVGSKSSHVVHFSVKAGDIITWEFATLKRDIGFGILFECSVIEEKKLEDGEITDVDSITSGYGVIPILPIFKVKCNISPIFGSHEAVTDGVYVMTWDNSYSRFFAKDLYYRISTQTEVCQTEYPYGIISFQQHCSEAHGGGANGGGVHGSLGEVDETSSESEAGEHTLCDVSIDERNIVRVITQNNVNDAETVYFDVSRNSSCNNVHDL